MTRLEQLRTTQAGALPPRLKSEIKRELQRLELVVEMIATLEAERNAIVADEASTHPNAKKIQTLHKLKAIGPEFAAVLVGEIFHRDFNNRRQLASYVGFAPSPFRSGNVAHDQGISKAGTRYKLVRRVPHATQRARLGSERNHSSKKRRSSGVKESICDLSDDVTDLSAPSSPAP
jgi:transposase